MSSQSCLAVPDNLLEYPTRERPVGTLRAAIASRMAELRSAWEASRKPSPFGTEHRAPGRPPTCGHRPRSRGSWICGAPRPQPRHPRPVGRQ